MIASSQTRPAGDAVEADEVAEHALPDLAKIDDRRVAVTAIADLAARVATLVLGIVTTALLARHLGASGFAAFSYAIAWGMLFRPLTDFGLNQAAVNRLSVRDQPPAQIVGSLLLMRFLMSLVFGVIAGVLAVATAPDNTVAVGSLIVCLGMILSTPSCLAAVIQTAMRPALTILSNISSAVSWAVIAVILIVMDSGPVALIAGITVAGLASSLFQAGIASRLTTIGRPTRGALVSLLRLSIPLGLGAIAATIYYRIDSVMLYQISGADEAGYYAVSYRLVDQVQIIPIAIVGALFPMISEAAHSDPARLRRFVCAGWEILMGMALPIVAIGVVVAHPLIGLLFGSEFEGPSGTVLIIIWPVVIAIFLGYLGGALVPALDIVKIWTVIAFAGAAGNVVLNLILIPPFAANGAAVATIATEFPVALVTLWVGLRRAKLSLPMGRVARMAAAAVLTGLVTFAVVTVSLELAIIVGGLSYAVGLHLFGVVRLSELFAAVRSPRTALRSLG